MTQAQKIIQLDQFLKLSGLVSTGGQAKVLIQGGEVKLNGVVETRRKKKIKAGDVVELFDRRITVEFE
jgi:ribosome-associated protein